MLRKEWRKSHWRWRVDMSISFVDPPWEMAMVPPALLFSPAFDAGCRTGGDGMGWDGRLDQATACDISWGRTTGIASLWIRLILNEHGRAIFDPTRIRHLPHGRPSPKHDRYRCQLCHDADQYQRRHLLSRASPALNAEK